MLELEKVGAKEGVGCLIAGWRVGLRDPTVRRQVVKSLVVNGIVFVVLFVALIWTIFALTSGLAGDHPGWPGWLSWVVSTAGWLLRVALVIGALMIAPPIIMLLLGIVLPMFMGPVFRAGRLYADGPEVKSAGGFRAEVRSVVIDLRRLVRLLVVSALILPLNLLPVVGQVAYVGAQGLIAAHTLGWDLVGRHFTLYGVGYHEQRVLLEERRGLVLSVGFAALAVLMLPLANVVFVTTNVAGAGILSARLDGAAPPGERPKERSDRSEARVAPGLHVAGPDGSGP
jgi:CysZ protein